MKLIKLNISCDSIDAAFEHCSNDMKNAEEEVNNLYHILEYVSLNAVQMMKVSKKLKQALIVRREAKEQFSRIQSLKDNVYAGLKKYEAAASNSVSRAGKYSEESTDNAKRLGII